MDLQNRTVVITGAARGIGRALAQRCSLAGANVVIADRLYSEAQTTAKEIGALAVACDVAKESDIQQLVAETENHFGPIDLFCSNAGVCYGEADTSTSASNARWQSCWDIHVMAHVFAARAVLPGMIERGDGYLLQMASAAGLLSQIGDAAYSASKHAAVGFAESLAITHGDDGIKVSLVCPQYVATSMLGYTGGVVIDADGSLIGPEQVVDAIVAGLEQEQFLILPHPEVADYFEFKASNYGHWLGGMRKLRRKVIAKVGSTRLQEIHKFV